MSNFTLAKNMQYRTTTQKYMGICTLPLTNNLNKAWQLLPTTQTAACSAYK